MIKIIYGLVSGFVLWSVLWIASDVLLLILSPEWYGEGVKNFNTPVLLIGLIRSTVISLICGFVASFVARRSGAKTALILGVCLLAFGVYIEAQLWNSLPLWYHLIFLASLIPATYAGGRLRGV